MGDNEALRNCFAATLDADFNLRAQSELQLKNADRNPGFIGATLHIVIHDTNPIVQQAAAVYLKNKIARAWDVTIGPAGLGNIADSEKAGFRDGLVPALVTSNAQTRSQLRSMLSKILSFDFPQHWSSLLDITLQLLRSHDVDELRAGVLCLLEICKMYRWKTEERREGLEAVISSAFPLALRIANELCDNPSDDAGEILHNILKSYKSVITVELSPLLQKSESLVPWGTLFLRIASKEAPARSLEGSSEDREVHPWWKAKKWAFYILNRLFIRYGNPNSLSGQHQDKYTEFANIFLNNFAPEILKAYLQLTEAWVSEKIWLSKWGRYHMITYFDECVKLKSLWAFLKSNVEVLISHVVFPVLCFQPSDAELWENDPVEYIHRKIDFFDDSNSPDIAACGLLITLASKRKTSAFPIITTFISNKLAEYSSATSKEKKPNEMEGVLRMIGSITHIILAKNSPLASHMESLFNHHIFPAFRSEHGFLRARACQLTNSFADMEWKDPNDLTILYNSVHDCMSDPDLPVRVEASLALQPLIRHDFVRQAMTPQIAQIMQRLLQLANEVDVDTLSNVMEEFVEVFATELTPFAVELTQSLRDTFLRITQEMLDSAPLDADVDEDKYDYTDDKSLAALGVLNTISTLILTLESTPDVLLKLEDILYPVIKMVIDNELIDLYGETFEIVDSCSFSSKSISPVMWKIFELLYKCVKEGGLDFIDELLPALDNYVSYGGDFFRTQPQYMSAIVDIIDTVFAADRLSANDRICGCKLSEAVLLHHRGYADQHLLKFVDIAMQRLVAPGHVKAKSYRIYLIEMVVNTLYYNPITTLRHLESKQWTSSFFHLWFSNMDNFKRVHDKKLAIVTIVTLLSLPKEHIPESVETGWSQLMHGLVSLFKTLPSAQKNREEMEKEIGTEDFSRDWTNAEDEWDDALEDEDGDVRDDQHGYLDYLAAQARSSANVEDDEEVDDELDEEPLFETPLDRIDPYVLFHNYLQKARDGNSQELQCLTSSLSVEEQQVITAVMHRWEQSRAASANGNQHAYI